jgi:hypothetical protein
MATVSNTSTLSRRELLPATAIAYSVNGRLAAQLDRLQGLGFMPSSVVGGERDFNQFEGPLYVYPKFTSCSSSIGPFIGAPVKSKTGQRGTS